MPANGGILDQLLSELSAARGGGQPTIGFRHDTPTGTPDTRYYTGPGGLFSVPGMDWNAHPIISTRVHPSGLADRIPARGTLDMNPLYPFISSFVAPTGTDPNGVCDDPMTAGPVKNCFTTAAFGRYSYMTREFDLTSQGRRVNGNDPSGLRLFNPPFLENTNSITTPNIPGNPSLDNEMLMRMVELGVAFQNKLNQQLYSGNPVNNKPGGGYREYPGLDILIGTGKKDAITGTPCPGIDSYIADYNYARADVDGGTRIVKLMTAILRHLRRIAETTNMSPVTWSIVMRSNLFYELTEVWPCAYATTGCVLPSGNANGASLTVMANDQIAMRDNMRRGSYLMVDGSQVEVIFDDTLDEDTSTTTNRVSTLGFASDIYIIPRTARGMVTLFWEYVDYQQGAMEAVRQGNLGAFFWTDGGRFLWHAKPPKNWCVQWLALIEPRIVLLTPHLAARIKNIQYAPMIHERDPFTDDPYFTDLGGVSARPGPSFYAEWKA